MGVIRLAVIILVAIGFFLIDQSSLSWNLDKEEAGLSYFILVLFNVIIVLFICAIALTGSFDQRGRIKPPDSFPGLFIWLVVLISVVSLVGRLINYKDYSDVFISYYKESGVTLRISSEYGALIDGEIGNRTYESLQFIFSAAPLRYLELQSYGGIIEYAEKIGDYLSDHGIDTVVRQHCESACVIVAISGRKLFATRGSQFGFHRARSIARQESQVGRYLGVLGTDVMLDLLAQRGIPDTIIERARRTHSGAMFYVSGQDLYELGVVDTLID